MVRLRLVVCGATAAARAGVFARAEEGLDAAGRAAAEGLRGAVRRVDQAWCGPERRAIETATALGVEAAVAPALRDAAVGVWEGRGLGEVDPAALGAWLAGVGAAPGGERVAAVMARLGEWMAGLEAERVLAVTHQAVARAAVLLALGAGAGAFRAVEVRPLAAVSLRGSRGRWVLTGVGRW